MKIAILDDYQDCVKNLSSFEKLSSSHEVVVYTDTPPQDVLIERLQDVDALILIRERTEINESLLSHLPQLKLISQTGKKSNHLDIKSCTAHNVAVAEGVGSPIAPAELCWTLILSASRHISFYVNNLKKGLWQNSGSLGLGRSLNGLTLGIWGYGKIGKKIAQYGKAFGMNILVWGSEVSCQNAQNDGFQKAVTKEEIFKHSDILSLHLRLVPATHHCVTFNDLSKMKNDSLFVNTSRSALVEQGALYKALQLGRPAKAALDVFDNEPATGENEPLLSLDQVVATPHLGYVEQNSYELYFDIAFQNVIDFFKGTPQNIANPEVL